MGDLKKIISFVYPITRKVPTTYNGVVEITLVNGGKVLDSKNTNYSFGSLQRVLEFALSKIYHDEIRSVLILGLGGGSVVASLRDKFGYKAKITAVEIDPVIIKVANDEFGIKEDGKLKIVNQDAVTFVRHGSGVYDLIVIDIFIDDTIPAGIFQEDFWHALVRQTTPEASLIFNSLSCQSHARKVSDFLAAEGCEVKVFDNVEGMNRIVIANMRRPKGEVPHQG